jgi:hypothetical protein
VVNVRFWHLADMTECRPDVRFQGQSRHRVDVLECRDPSRVMCALVTMGGDQLRIPTARDATSAMVASEMADSAIISSLALTVSGNVSAGENAVALVKAKNK